MLGRKFFYLFYFLFLLFYLNITPHLQHILYLLIDSPNPFLKFIDIICNANANTNNNAIILTILFSLFNYDTNCNYNVTFQKSKYTIDKSSIK